MSARELERELLDVMQQLEILAGQVSVIYSKAVQLRQEIEKAKKVAS